MANRAHDEPGWIRIGRWDSARRRALWARVEYDYDGARAIELCSGREGDDDYVRIERDNPAFRDLHEVLSTQLWSQET